MNFHQGNVNAHEVMDVFCNRTNCAALFLDFTA